MVRRRYYYRRTIRPKQKWAINVVDSRVVSGSATLQPATDNVVSFGRVVCTNSSRVNSQALSQVSSAQILKTGRWKFKGLLTNVTTNLNYIIYLVYVPEGMLSPSPNFSGLVGDEIFYQHPEWVIAWTRKDYVSIEQSNEVSLTGRLKRNLNTGDSIQLRVLVQNMGSESVSFSSTTILRGTVSYCCRAN